MPNILQIISIIGMIIVGILYAYQLIYLFVPLLKRRRREKGPYPQKRYAFVIAARNEETVIGHLLDSICQQDYPAELITTYVVADNCTDSTAQIARDHGARVYTRTNKAQVGKGYALEWIFAQIKEQEGYDHFDAFVILDADNILKRDYLTQLNKTAAQGYQVFSSYRNTKNFGQSWIASGHSLWYLHDSCHLNRSRALLNVGCMVTGTGYGFVKELLEETKGWPFHCLTEDIEFSTWCAIHKIKIGFAHNAILYDEQPSTMNVSWRQRTRWSQGGIQVSVRYFRDYFRGIKNGGWSGWSTFEAMTLGLWGYGIAGFSAVLGMVTAAVSAGIWGLALAIAGSLVGTYLSMALLAGYTVLTERKKILATGWQKVKSVLTFPLFMATFIMIAICSLFQKFEWTPIAHTEAISVENLENK